MIIGGRIEALPLSSNVSKAFSTGVDVKSYPKPYRMKEAEQFFRDVSILLDGLAHFPIPTIAIVNGYTFGAGAHLSSLL